MEVRTVIRIGEVHCLGCGDAFEPDGLPNFDEPNFCSEECEEKYWQQDADQDAYSEARYGAAPAF